MAKDYDDSEDEMVYIVMKDEYDDKGEKMKILLNMLKESRQV